jgi:hypothetical protein
MPSQLHEALLRVLGIVVLSAMTHGHDADIGKSAQIAMAAQLASIGLDEDRSRLYFDLVLNSLSEAAGGRCRPWIHASTNIKVAIGERLLTAKTLQEALGS